MRTAAVTTLMIAALLALAFSALAAQAQPGERLFEFERFTGNARPFIGGAEPIRGVNAGGLPWVIDKAEARLSPDGLLEVEVDGLVIDPDDAAAQDARVAGTNPVPAFRAILSCLTTAGVAAPDNTLTAAAPATADGDARIVEQLDLPDTCIAPIVFVTSPAGAWFAASGF